MNFQETIDWLLDGDVSIQYQTYQDLLSEERSDLQERISREGWGAQYLSKRKENGHWGLKFYQPKWISTHYTLLDLRNLCISPEYEAIRETIAKVLNEEKGPDGGILPIGTVKLSDVCVNGMFLNYASYFQAPESQLQSVIDFLLKERMADGGFNCHSNRIGAVHSSLHTTLSVLEGITEYQRNGYRYRVDELESARKTSIEFILQHRLFLSDKTGEIIKKDFLKLTYPGRWKYDILRALDYFRYSGVAWDERMHPAIEEILKKRNKQGTWNLQAKHPGQEHFEMEKAGQPSRWNTLRVLRVLGYYDMDLYSNS